LKSRQRSAISYQRRSFQPSGISNQQEMIDWSRGWLLTAGKLKAVADG